MNNSNVAPILPKYSCFVNKFYVNSCANLVGSNPPKNKQTNKNTQQIKQNSLSLLASEGIIEVNHSKQTGNVDLQARQFLWFW